MQKFIVRTQPKPSNTKRVRVGEYLGTYWATNAQQALCKAGRVAGSLTRGESHVEAVPPISEAEWEAAA